MSKMFYEDVFRELARSDVKYLVAGGVAINLHGVPRLTYDLDILIDLRPENSVAFFEALARLGFRTKVPVTATDFADARKRRGFVKEKGMRVLTFWQDSRPIREIDVFVENPIGFRELWRNKVEIRLGADLQIHVVAIDDLIALKRFANRKQDIADIESLRKAKRLANEEERG
jgi:hypothetical protein